MKRIITICAMLAVILAMTGISAATLTYYTDKTIFETTFTGLTVENFDNGTGATGSFTGPLNSSSNNTKFQPGDIVDGVEFSVSLYGLYVSTYGGSKALGCQQLAPGVTMTIDFLNDNVTAMGMNIVDDTGYSPNPTVTVYDIYNNVLGTWYGSVAANGSIYFGVASDSAKIGKITVWSGPSPTIDNVSFIPEPATIALLGLGALSLIKKRK